MTINDATTERTTRIWEALQARRDAFDGHHSFLGSDVPADRLEHAAAKFMRLEPGERVLAFLDETVTANGKGGIVVTDRAIHTRQFGEGVHHQHLDAIRSVDVGGVFNAKLLVNGRELVSSTISENRSAVVAIREALVEGLGLGTPTGTPAAPLPPAAQGLVPAGWNADPSGRHQYRYWDGTSWTEHVSDEGVAAVDPLAEAAEETAPEDAAPSPTVAAAPPAAAAAPEPVPQGSISMKLKDSGAWNFPAMCVVCASPDVVGVVQYHGEKGLNRVVSIDLAFPICSTCRAVAEQAGLKPDGSWKAFKRAPKELRPRVKEIGNAVKLKPVSAYSSTPTISFTFANGRFGAAFRELNP